MAINPYLMPEGPIACQVSGGRTSGMLARQIQLNNPGRTDIYYLFQNTGKERKETYDFIQNMANYWQLPIIWLQYKSVAPFFDVVGHNSAARNSEPFDQLIAKKKRVPNAVERFCTQELKVRTARRYMRSLGFKIWHTAIGFRADEGGGRVADIQIRKAAELAPRKIVREIPLTPLADAEVFIFDVINFWKEQPFNLKLPVAPNGKTIGGNCKGCFLHSEYERARICKYEPHEAEWYIAKENQVGGTFDKKFSWAELKKHAEESPEFAFGESNHFCTTGYGNCTEF